MTVEDQRVAHYGMGDTVGRFLVFFHADTVMVCSHDPDWMQHTMNAIVVLFRRYGLVANVTKSRTMICQPGTLREGGVGGVRGAEVHGGGELVPGETPEADLMSRV